MNDINIDVCCSIYHVSLCLIIFSICLIIHSFWFIHYVRLYFEYNLIMHIFRIENSDYILCKNKFRIGQIYCNFYLLLIYKLFNEPEIKRNTRLRSKII